MRAMLVDLRSDTVTKPSAGMRAAMAGAEVGDDVYRDDPSVLALEEEVAALLGKPAALFVPTGSMANQIAILCHAERGDELIAGEGAHCAFYEVGAAAALGGVQFAFAGKGGLFTAEEAAEVIKAPAYYLPRTRLIAIENTHNRAGGRVFPQKDVLEIAALAQKHGFKMHLDGARIWNASVASGLSPADLAAPFDTISVCFSKGLGAPVGSALVGARDVIDRALRFRKMLGGGMRQAGVLAAAASYALRNHRERLVEDHAAAALIAETVRTVSGVHIDAVETNIVNVDVPSVPAEALVNAAKARGVLIGASGPHRVRIVTHLDLAKDDVPWTAQALAAAVRDALADVSARSGKTA
ncbi:MAG: low-specificity L-threonine aldolase [Polyangiaceae bacterium]|nr:low-specificity L-threonine aldolase [Polyangiaceae bacterium]